jgi:hypothetical protein
MMLLPGIRSRAEPKRAGPGGGAFEMNPLEQLMNPNRLAITSVLLFGSLWGLSELGIDRIHMADGVPRAPLLTAAAIIFLVTARRVWDAPGSSFSLAILASAFKFVQSPFFGCKIAAVLILGGVFDIALSLARGRKPSAWSSAGSAAPYARTAVAALASFVAFGFFARYVLANPFWVAGGAPKLLEYQLVHGAIGAGLAIPATYVGLRAGAWITEAAESWSGAGALGYRLLALASGAAGVAVALVTRG